MSLSFDFWPEAIATCDFLRLKYSAKSFIRALLALPPTGGAVRCALKPSASLVTEFLLAFVITFTRISSAIFFVAFSSKAFRQHTEKAGCLCIRSG